MSSISNKPDFNQVLKNFKTDIIDKYLPDSSDRITILLESTALLQLTQVCLKNLPYTLFERGFFPRDIRFFTSRADFFETMLISVVSMVHNLAMALIFTVALITTFGLSYRINYSCRKHWSHFGYGLTAAFIASIGTIVPLFGLGLFSLVGKWQIKSIQKDYSHDIGYYEKQLIKTSQAFFKTYRENIFKYFHAQAISETNWIDNVKPFLQEKIENPLYTSKKMSNLTEIIKNIWKDLPYMGLGTGRSSRRVSHSPKTESQSNGDSGKIAHSKGRR